MEWLNVGTPDGNIGIPLEAPIPCNPVSNRPIEAVPLKSYWEPLVRPPRTQMPGTFSGPFEQPP